MRRSQGDDLNLEMGQRPALVSSVDVLQCTMPPTRSCFVMHFAAFYKKEISNFLEMVQTTKRT